MPLSTTLLRLQLTMAKALLLAVAFAGLFSAAAAACSSQTFSGNRLYSLCADLPTLSSSLHWTYDPSSSLSLAFVAAPPSPAGWVAWAINPTASGMVGAQSLIALSLPNGSLSVETFNVSSYGPVSPSPIAFEVSDTEAEYVGGKIRMFARVVLPAGMTKLNQVWQVGSSVTNGVPGRHAFDPPNLNAKGTLDLTKGEAIATGGADSRARNKNIHGVLNVVSWGILLPIGAIIARYLRTFKSADPAWFYLHVTCQSSAYVIGVAGWGTGLKLGSQSKGVVHSTHRNIGIALFCLATLQVFALLLRPKKEHKLRFYWNIYHHSVGYAVIILTIINIFQGFDILNPDRKWKIAYTVVLCILGAIAVILELVTWVIFIREKSDKTARLYDRSDAINGSQV